MGGMDMPDSWGVVTLILEAASVIAMFAQLNWGRTSFSLQWAVPLVWAVVVLSVGCWPSRLSTSPLSAPSTPC
jgi:hypothetical protein